MDVMQPHYHDELRALLPPGIVYALALGGALDLYLAALADELARVHGTADLLLEESDPRTTQSMLVDWENDYGLPDLCSGEIPDIDTRRKLLLAKINANNSPLPEYFVELAALFGYTITVVELQPHNVRKPVNYPLYPASIRYVWRVVSPLTYIRRFTVRSPVNAPLSVWGNAILECLIRRAKPAHTLVQFIYSDSDPGLALRLRVTASGESRMTVSGEARMTVSGESIVIP